MNNNWKKEEIKLLKKYYPILGSKITQFLPSRTIDAIEHEARRQNIKYGLFKVGEEGYIDIETTNLNADFAFMLSYCIKTRSKDEYRYSVIEREEILSGILDKRIVKDLIKDMRKYKRLYGYYSSKFDIPFIRTRALVHNYEFIPYGLIQHQDLYYLVKTKLKLSRNRLDNLCNILGIEGKTHLKPLIWTLASTGDEKSLKYVLGHNKADVMILEKAHKRILEYGAIQKRSL